VANILLQAWGIKGLNNFIALFSRNESL